VEALALHPGSHSLLYLSDSASLFTMESTTMSYLASIPMVETTQQDGTLVSRNFWVIYFIYYLLCFL
jgi:hypothetical protein